jgi:hypothetical protein
VRAVVKNFGRQVRNRVPVELWADGRRVKQQSVDLAPNGEASVRFAYRFESPGDHVVEARIEGDRLDVDNHRWLSVSVKEAVRVLCVDGSSARGPGRSAASYLAAAIAPRRSSNGQILVRAEVKPENSLDEVSLNAYDCVCLVNVAQFTAAEAKSLQSYLKAGGAIVFFLGDQVEARRYNRRLGPDRGGAGILPVAIGDVAGPQTRLDPLDYRHPIVRPFQGQERAGLLTTPVQKYYRLSLPKGSTAQVALAFGNGDAMIVDAPVDRGHVFVVATSPDIAWTALPVWPSFVPLVQEMLACALAGQLQHRNLLVGEPLGGTCPLVGGEMAFALRMPSGRSETMRLRAVDDLSVWNFDGTTRSGVYAAQFGPPLNRTDRYAVNVDTAESDLTPLSPDQVREELWSEIPFVHQTTWRNLETQPAAAVARPSDLAKDVLYVVLVLLLVESYLARRFGHYAT